MVLLPNGSVLLKGVVRTNRLVLFNGLLLPKRVVLMDGVIGVNILLVGTNYGAASDVDGNYYIINIPPGIYTLKVSMIGFATKTIQGIKVSVDQTTKIDIELGEATIEMQDVVVSAEGTLVRKDLTSTEAKVSGDQIALLPFEDVQSVSEYRKLLL